ncbi:hypothetical protein [Xanthovirga aplysinae]|uniref:hypothetical protein n=1 Tax=Xanthovirga aplysinae TaxID=2529853 RepID=UPI0012BD193F|nr:hypothetical protein [Xanthovirga aplysinae]MTI29545.1 hypothetical protein [Xanthovirga aplysinae]
MEEADYQIGEKIVLTHGIMGVEVDFKNEEWIPVGTEGVVNDYHIGGTYRIVFLIKGEPFRCVVNKQYLKAAIKGAAA